MKIEELKNDYLLSIGCKLSNKYDYLYDDEFDYNKKVNDKVIKINDLEILLSKKKANMLKFLSLIKKANKNYNESINEYTKKLTADGEDVKEEHFNPLCEYCINEAKNYFVDYIKFTTDKLKVDETFLQHLITLTNASIMNMFDSLNKAMETHNNNILNINLEMNSELYRKNQETMDKAANAPKMIVTNSYESIWGNTVYTSGTVVPTTSSAQINSELGSNYSSSMMLNNMNISSENAKGLTNLIEQVANVINKYNNDLVALVSYKLTQSFEQIDGESLSDNPTNLKNWDKILKDIDEKDYPKLKEIFEFYNIDMGHYLEQYTINQAYNYYVENKKDDYSSIDLKIYTYFKGNNLDEYNNRLGEKIYDYYVEEINNGIYKKSKKKEQKFCDDITLEFNKCSYLSKEKKDKLKNEFDKALEKKALNKKAKRKKLLIKLLIISLIVIAVGVLIYFFWEQIKIIITVLVVLAIIVGIFKFFMT